MRAATPAGQRDCAACHAASKKASRARKAARLAALERLFAARAFDPETKRRFEQKFISRLVVVQPRLDSADPDYYCGYAIGFKPGNMVVVEYSAGKTIEAELEQLCRDPAFLQCCGLGNKRRTLIPKGWHCVRLSRHHITNLLVSLEAKVLFRAFVVGGSVGGRAEHLRAVSTTRQTPVVAV